MKGVERKSPSGSLFPYYYKNGALHCLKYGSYYRNEDALLETIEREERFFIESGERLNVWIDLYCTRISGRVLDRLIGNLCAIAPQARRIAIVMGASPLSELRIKSRLRRRPELSDTAIRFFRDPEDAKTWIVV